MADKSLDAVEMDDVCQWVEKSTKTCTSEMRVK